MERIERLLDRLPGYAGYRDLENRRDIDRRLRESIADQLESIARRTERGGAALVANQRFAEASAVEQLIRSLDHAANLVRTQSYGYGGIFTDTPVDERVLNQLYLFDKGLSLKSDQLDQQLAGIETAVTGSGDLNALLTESRSSVQNIIDSLAARSAVIETATPAPSQSLFSPVDAAAETPPPPPITIAVGDAIAWFDEDFLVDAVIDVQSGTDRVRFFHLEQNPDKWLVIADRAEQLIALITGDTSAPAQGTVAWSLAGVGKTERAGEKPVKAEVTITCYASDGENVAFRLLSGTDERYLTGKRVHPDDLAVYGKPARP